MYILTSSHKPVMVTGKERLEELGEESPKFCWVQSTISNVGCNFYFVDTEEDVW